MTQTVEMNTLKVEPCAFVFLTQRLERSDVSPATSFDIFRGKMHHDCSYSMHIPRHISVLGEILLPLYSVSRVVCVMFLLEYVFVRARAPIIKLEEL